MLKLECASVSKEIENDSFFLDRIKERYLIDLSKILEKFPDLRYYEYYFEGHLDLFSESVNNIVDNFKFYFSFPENLCCKFFHTYENVEIYSLPSEIKIGVFEKNKIVLGNWGKELPFKLNIEIINKINSQLNEENLKKIYSEQKEYKENFYPG